MYFRRLLAVAAGSVLFLVPSTAASASLIGNVTVSPTVSPTVVAPVIAPVYVNVSSNDCIANVSVGVGLCAG